MVLVQTVINDDVEFSVVKFFHKRRDALWVSLVSVISFYALFHE